METVSLDSCLWHVSSTGIHFSRKKNNAAGYGRRCMRKSTMYSQPEDGACLKQPVRSPPSSCKDTLQPKLEENSCHRSGRSRQTTYDENILDEILSNHDRQVKDDPIEDYELLVEGLKRTFTTWQSDFKNARGCRLWSGVILQVFEINTHLEIGERTFLHADFVDFPRVHQAHMRHQVKEQADVPEL
ncbi:hypothetical protein KIN20_033960 [Parelaphostrongylus tenuis]|uniref:Uncharacterized protein n=1 Tax=Parelaphostrongylus tenuis TaxID=148309 RepID=A0AAD5R9E5_PARTN|nr:hypothetical protein KIN20_033960 [Parelaphostrongylus tenuis]